MADDFDRFLANALSPPERDGDRVFVSRVQARIAIEQRFATQRRFLVRGLEQQFLALLAVGGGAWWLGRAAPIAAWAGESPAAALAILIGMFMFLVAVVTARTGAGQRADLTF
jgi:hypothetical protein